MNCGQICLPMLTFVHHLMSWDMQICQLEVNLEIMGPQLECFWTSRLSQLCICSIAAWSGTHLQITDSSPPCLMLSLIFIGSVRPYLVWILAVRFAFSSLASLRFFPWIPFLWRAYRIASSHALSYAFWTSRKITYAVLPFTLVSWIVCFSVMISTCFFILSLTILSYTLLALLARVIPLSLEHYPFFLCLCITVGFLLLASWGVCFLLHGFYWRYCRMYVLFLGQLLWMLRWGFCLVLGFFPF